MSQRSVPAPFLTKTYQLVDDRSTDDVVSWNENGTTFIVWKTDDFSKNLLPTYFKHNNFSSFVRQLNTYGFRKIVPDKWEFSNDNFNRGQKELLTKIHRRKSAATSPSPIPDAVGQTCPVNSSEDLGPGSTSTSSSRDSRNPGSVEASNVAKLGVISEENKKLKIENQKLSSELAQTKNQCDGLIGFLTKYVKVGSDQINHIVSQGSFKSSPDDDVDVDADGSVGEKGRKSINNECDDDENGECMKLFGVWMKERKKKRSGEEMMDFGGAHRKETKKAAKFGAPWMKVGSYPGDSSKVCN